VTILTLSNCDLVESQGSGYVIMNFARGLESKGHRLKLLGPQDCILLPKLGKARSLRLALGLWRKAVRLVKELQPDIVEFYGGEAWLATDRLSRMANRRFKIVAHSNGIEPFVNETLAQHGIHNTANGARPKWYQGRMRFPVEKAFTRADAIVTVSQPEADYAVRRGFQPRERVLAIDNALLADFLGQPFMAVRPNTIGYCGSWLARKGASLLATDLAEALRAAPGWKLHLVGVGKEFQASNHFPDDVVPRVQVTGFVSDKAELRRIYQSWAIALMPSIYESFGLVAAEAMACGCALVANRTGFAATLADGQEAMLLSEQASPHLANAVLRLIRDEPLRNEIARRGHERVQSLHWKNSITRLERFFLQLTQAQ
jgi:glycosyltransferase involved in cell wall biosynthesis